MVTLEDGDLGAVQQASLPGVSRAAVVLVIGIAVAVVLGWTFDLPTLASVVPGYTEMKFNTALCLLALATAVLVRSPRTAVWCAVPVLLLVGVTLVEILTASSFGIDELIVSDPHPPRGPSGQMAPATAVSLLALGTSIVALNRARPRLGEVLLVVPLLLGSVTLLGYLFDAAQLYRVSSLSSVALNTAFAVVLLTAAVAGRVPGGLLAWAADGIGPGVVVVRQTVPVVLAGLTALGLAVKLLGDAKVLGPHIGLAVMVLLGSLIAVGATVRVARRLDSAHLAQLRAEVALRELNASLVAGRDAAWAHAQALADELVEERARFDRAVSRMDDIVWTVETTGGTMELIYSTPNTEGIYGGQLGPEDDFFQKMSALVDPADRQLREDFFRRMMAGEPAEMEIGVVGIDGQHRWLWARGAPRTEGERTFYDGITTNVTERRLLSEQRERLLEQEQLQVERLSELSRVRDEFIAVAGHELRTPVSVILGYCELLTDPDVSAVIERQAIEVISRRAAELNQLVERVFDLARLDAGAMDLDLEPVQLRPFLDALVADHQPAATASGISLTATSPDVTLYADRARLRQVFDNLLSNSLKYTSCGGHVRLEVQEHDDEIVFELADDGIGVPAEELPRLFERLFRATSARDARIPGTGLGLAVTKALVEAHGGTMSARANEPHGLIVSVVLPKVRAAIAV